MNKRHFSFSPVKIYPSFRKATERRCSVLLYAGIYSIRASRFVQLSRTRIGSNFIVRATSSYCHEIPNNYHSKYASFKWKCYLCSTGSFCDLDLKLDLIKKSQLWRKVWDLGGELSVNYWKELRTLTCNPVRWQSVFSKLILNWTEQSGGSKMYLVVFICISKIFYFYSSIIIFVICIIYLN